MPTRGEVWLADLGLVEKTRPVLVLNVPFGDADRSQFEVGVSVSFLKEGAFVVQQPVTIPPIRLLRRPGVLSPQQMALVETGVRHWFPYHSLLASSAVMNS